uniref:Uncharacterized protein n=1 Tax=Boechera divaricarpa TaxID=115915 RepID=B6REL6_9BRAS|nr:hypothetical protein [Boechera divaricarpa]
MAFPLAFSGNNYGHQTMAGIKEQPLKPIKTRDTKQELMVNIIPLTTTNAWWMDFGRPEPSFATMEVFSVVMSHAVPLSPIGNFYSFTIWSDIAAKLLGRKLNPDWSVTLKNLIDAAADYNLYCSYVFFPGFVTKIQAKVHDECFAASGKSLAAVCSWDLTRSDAASPLDFASGRTSSSAPYALLPCYLKGNEHFFATLDHHIPLELRDWRPRPFSYLLLFYLVDCVPYMINSKLQLRTVLFFLFWFFPPWAFQMKF